MANVAGNNLHVWLQKEVDILVECLENIVENRFENGYMNEDGSFKAHCTVEIEHRLSVILPESNITARDIKLRINKLKKEYHLILRILGIDGFWWDDDSSTLEPSDDDDLWNYLYWIMPAARGVRHKEFPFMDRLCGVFII